MFTGMRRSLLAVLAVGLSALTTSAEEKIVEAKGEGVDQTSARGDAVRKALEVYAGTELASKSKLQNFVLVKDTVLSRVAGLASWVDEPKYTEGIGGTVICTGRLKIKTEVVDATWAEVKEAVDALGRPKIMLVWRETIFDVAREVQNREVVQFDSSVKNEISRRLVDTGFLVVSSEQMNDILQKRMQEALMRDDKATLASLAKEFGAAIIVRGTARVSGPEQVQASGIGGFVWQVGRLNIEAVWAETGDVICNEGISDTKAGSTVPGTAGADVALASAGKRVVPLFMNALLTNWTRRITGGGDIILEVNGIPDFKSFVTLRKFLQGIKDVESVNGNFVKDGATVITVTGKFNAQKFAETLVDVKGLPLDIRDQKLTRIFADFKTPPPGP